MELADYSAAPIAASALKAAGFGGAVRYISPARANWMKGKPMSKAEVADFKRHGLEIVMVWQHLKEDWRRGRAGGVADAKAAVAKAAELGAPHDSVIYMAIDSNPNLWEWNNIAVEYVRGAQSVLGSRLGLYCNTKCKAWGVEDGISFWWWKHNWGSDGDVSGCHIHQYEIDRYKVAGVTVDRNRTMADSFGAWSQAPSVVKAAGATDPRPKPPSAEPDKPVAPATPSQTLLGLFSTKYRSLVHGSTFETTLPTFLRLSDAASYRTEKKLEIARQKLVEITALLGEPKNDECKCDCDCDTAIVGGKHRPENIGRW